MKNCPNCGYEIFEESKFCPACGSPVKAEKPVDYQPNPVQQYDPFSQKDPFGMPTQQPNSFSQPDPFETVAFSNRQNSYVPLGQRVQGFKRENHIIFIFVTTLIFMIEFGIGCISVLSALSDLSGMTIAPEAYNLYNFIIFESIAVFVTFLVVLICFILAATLRKQANPLEKRINKSRTLFILSITAFLLILLYFVAEILIIVEGNNVLPAYMEENSLNLIRAIIFDSVFLILAFVNIFKAKMFTKELERKLREKNGNNFNN